MTEQGGGPRRPRSRSRTRRNRADSNQENNPGSVEGAGEEMMQQSDMEMQTGAEMGELAHVENDAPIMEEVDVPREPVAATARISLQVSRKLHQRLIDQAHEEGVGLDEYLAELLAEGATLRAWEILERNAGMRANQNRPNPQQPQQSQSGNNRNSRGGNNRGGKQSGGGGGGGGGRGRMNHTRYQTIMDDKAAFLEYVRSQERKNGNR